MNVKEFINRELTRLNLHPLVEEQVRCLHDVARIEEAAAMLEDLRDRCRVRLPPVLDGPFDSTEEAREAAAAHFDEYPVLALDELATDDSRRRRERVPRPRLRGCRGPGYARRALPLGSLLVAGNRTRARVTPSCLDGVTVRSTDDIAAQVEANSKLMNEVASFVHLLNGLSDKRVLRQACFGRKDYVDALGDLIPAGRCHFRKGEPSQEEDEVRLSAASMKKVVDVLFTHNRQGIELAERVNRERHDAIRRAVGMRS